MIVWGALVIPLAVAVWLLAFHRDEVVLWEFVVLLATGLGTVGGSKLLVEKVAVDDTEYWTGWAVSSTYTEAWNERVACRHTKYCETTDADGNKKKTACGKKHAYDVDEHPPDWEVTDSNGIRVKTNPRNFEDLGKRWGVAPRFVELNRRFHTKDGDQYVLAWPGTEETLEVVTTAHTYENRVQASNSIFNFPEIERPADRGLFDYPTLPLYTLRSILGNGGPTTDEAERILSVANAKLGRKKQVRMWILVYRGQPLETGFDQEAYWKRGNKNEFVLTIGTDSAHRVQWAYAFSWTEVEALKVDVRDFTLRQAGQTLDLVPVAEWLAQNIEARWIRKPFADFSYLTVDPPGWAVALAYLASAAVSLAVSFWAANNRFREP